MRKVGGRRSFRQNPNTSKPETKSRSKTKSKMATSLQQNEEMMALISRAVFQWGGAKFAAVAKAMADSAETSFTLAGISEAGLRAAKDYDEDEMTIAELCKMKRPRVADDSKPPKAKKAKKLENSPVYKRTVRELGTWPEWATLDNEVLKNPRFKKQHAHEAESWNQHVHKDKKDPKHFDPEDYAPYDGEGFHWLQ